MTVPYQRQVVPGTYKNKYAFEDLPPIRPCKGGPAALVTGCGRMTRPSRIKATKAPGTIPRADAYLCGKCKRSETEKRSKLLQHPEAPKPTKYDSMKIARIDELNSAYLVERKRRRLLSGQLPYVRRFAPGFIPPGAGRRRSAPLQTAS